MSGEPPRLALLGAGRMGAALLAGWTRAPGGPAPNTVLVVDPDRDARARASEAGYRTASALTPDAARELDTLFLAIKPQSLAGALGEVASRLPTGLLLVSVIAGARIEALTALARGARVVRAMPNTPAAVGRGVTAFVAAPGVTPEQHQRAVSLLAAVGDTVELPSEGLLDAATAVSGSGPAYVCLLAEALAEAGEAEGLPRDAARRLAWSTVAGTGALLAEPDA
ncbi:MAG: NAD(P)-binding domain-containing protein, partial [Caulobacterales bacterium]|nr:NAD(P)-binding domain-containing protein [Caulobacterales bacterium]